MFFIIIFVLIIIFTVSSATYEIIVYKNEKSNLKTRGINNAANYFNNYGSYLQSEEFFGTDLNDDYKNKNIYFCAYDSKFNLIGESGNYLPVSFTNNDSSESIGYIDYTQFRKSLTDKQYEKICDYLQKTESDGSYYQVRCTEHYFEKTIIPKKLEIVLTNKNNTWHNDKTIESILLNPNHTTDILFKTDKITQNTIDSNFILNKYDKSQIKDVVSKFRFTSSGSDDNLGKDVRLVNLGDFNFLLLSSKYVNKNELMISTNENNKYIHITQTHFFIYAEKFNVLENCIEQITLGIIIIFLFLLIIGIILCISVWRIIKNQAAHEILHRDMINAIAHDLKTPMFVIEGYAENLKVGMDNNKKQHYINVIQEQTNKMDSLVHRMLDLAKLESNKVKLNKEFFNLTTLVKEIAKKYENFSEKKIILNLYDNAEIKADYEMLKTAIDNMTDNAVKYAEEQDITICVSKHIFYMENYCSKQLSKERKNIWRIYYRAKSNKKLVSGNGIGLSIVKTIFDLHKFKYGININNGKFKIWFKF